MWILGLKGLTNSSSTMESHSLTIQLFVVFQEIQADNNI